MIEILAKLLARSTRTDGLRAADLMASNDQRCRERAGEWRPEGAQMNSRYCINIVSVHPPAPARINYYCWPGTKSDTSPLNNHKRRNK